MPTKTDDTPDSDLDGSFAESLAVSIPKGRYVDTASVALMFDTTQQVIRQKLYRARLSEGNENGRRRPPFPIPDAVIGNSPLWKLERVRDWAARVRWDIVGENLPAPPPNVDEKGRPVAKKPTPLADELTDAERKRINAENDKKLAEAKARKEGQLATLEKKRAAARAERDKAKGAVDVVPRFKG